MDSLPKEYLNVKTTDESMYLNFDLELPVKNGQAIAIQGRNGVGKTSLIKYLKEHRSSYWDESILINFVDQEEPQILEDLSLNNIVELLLLRVDRKPNEYYQFLFKKFDAAKFSDLAFFSLSGGQKQMAKILIGNLFQASIYFFDEPFQNLDMTNAKVLKEYLEKLVQGNHSIVIIEHHQEYLPKGIIPFVLEVNNQVVTHVHR